MSAEVYQDADNFGANYINANKVKDAPEYDSKRMLGYIADLEKLGGGKLKGVAPAVVCAILIAQRRADLVALLFQDIVKDLSKEETLKVFKKIREGINIIIAFVGIPNCVPACFGLIAELHARGIEAPAPMHRVTHKEADWYRSGLETRDDVYKLVGNPEVRSMLDTVFHELSYFARSSAFGYMIGGSLAFQTLEETEITLVAAITAMGATRQARSHCKAALGVGNAFESVEKVIAIAYEVGGWNGTPLHGEVDVAALAKEVEINRQKLEVCAQSDGIRLVSAVDPSFIARLVRPYRLKERPEHSPVDRKVKHKSSAASSEDAIKAIESAQKAFESWSQTKPTERRDIFLRAAEILIKRKQESHSYAAAETGLPELVSNTGFNLTYQSCIEIAGLINAIRGEVIPSTGQGSSALMYKEPYGVILSIGPWNSPYVLGFRAVLQPLAMGNTVVLKGPEASPATYWAIASVLQEAGLPAGCLNTIIHRREDAAEIASSMIAHPYVKKVNFTGSTTLGAAITSLAGKYLKPTVMELGGKAPSIICEDA
ncbi:vanillin dehydrogenase [Penicillium sp. IBT 35674x]|nr:vanillin dehydrogenase [Penicillium sp. IBT 35674x]